MEIRKIFSSVISKSLLTAAFLAGGASNAATYAYKSDTFAFDTPSAAATAVTWHTTGASPACTGFQNGDDDWADISFPAGFSFTFSGTSYTSVRVYSNGILAFPPDNSGFHRNYTPSALPITAASGIAVPTGCPNTVPANLMLPYWTDIQAGNANGTTGASVKYEKLTDALTGADRFVITWDNVLLYGSTTTRYTFQVQLFTSSPSVNSNFKFQYTTGASTGADAAVGVQTSGTDFTQYAFKQAFIDTTRGTAVLWYPANQLAGKGAEYRLDQGVLLGTPGEVIDTSGSQQNASITGLAQVTSTASGKICRAVSFSANTSNTSIGALATPITPASKGGIDMWYQSNVKWGTASSDAVLFDATTVAARPFFLLRRAGGTLRLVLTDSAGTVFTAETTTAYTFNAATWQHIGASWSLSPGTNQTVMQIMVNGVLATTTGSTPYRATSSGTIATLGTVYIGDNRTSGITPAGGSPNSANGLIDEINFYGNEVNATQVAADMNSTRATCASLDHFHLVHSGQSVSCSGAAASVTIEAHDSTHALINLSGTGLTLTTDTNHGTWVGVNAINPVTSNSNGGASYTFANESSIVLGLANPFAETLNINVASGSITERSGSATLCTAPDYTFGTTCDAGLTFSDSGYLFSVPNHLAEASQNITIKAVKKSDSSAACVAAYANTSRNLTFSCAYTNPSTGTLPVRVGAKALNAANNTAASCDANGQAVSIAFNGSGVGSTTLQYADVGTVSLTAKDTIAGVTTSGTTSFTTAPAGMTFSGYPTTTANAGAAFTAVVSAVNTAGAVTPNFGRESTPESVTVTAAKAQPTGAGAVNGTFSVTSMPAFAAGKSTPSMTWSEVGTIDLSAALADGNYLGTGINATGTTGTGGAVGRFIPDHFDTVITQGCTAGAYTYSGQPFTVKVTAMNKGNAVTKNYDGSAGTSPNFAKALTVSNSSGVAITASGATALPSAFTAGVATLTPAFTFNTKLTAPASTSVRATDADAASSSTGVEGTAALRSGRLTMGNAYGSPRLALQVPVVAEYWNGTNFVTNTNDLCTTFTASNFNLVNHLGGVTPTNLGNSRIASVANVSAGKWNVNINPPTPFLALSGGADLFMNLGATGANVTCPTATPGNAIGTSTSAGLGYLGNNACGSANYDKNPSSRLTFGIYKSPLIYSRESY